ncbi:CopL family metal-binding regulatory protein [Luteimonas mephitis]|jgi:hypothetical protein|uniref:CopL family metal-binding regulatory protein n=1 Tax=Luteimonas mephitis TaxID=83615 RepID=UPI00041EFD9D|nr:CopL family metal-binding regulatory protein [Luteimonas mephitis]
MAVWSIVLRLLLAAGLILNGSGYAVAAVHMQVGHMALADAGGHADAGVDASRVEHHPTTMPAPETGCEEMGSHTTRMASGDSPPGCCQSDACGCLCVNPACVAMPALAIMATIPGGTDMPQAMDLGRPAPALQGVIRPPIG